MDRLLEISDRVYVFDCCFSTEALEEYEYKVYLAGIVAQLQHSYPDSSFMVFNFKETDTRTQISDILSQYDMTVMEYPRQYEGCSLLPLEMIHHFLRSCESWLSLAGQQNMILVHCERGGWPVLAFMLAALLLFRKQYNGEQQTLEMVYKQAPRELLRVLTSINAQPSQLRYLQYISRRTVGSDWPPSDRPLALDHIVLRFLPLFDEKGCRPVIRIYGLDSPSTTVNRDSKLLFTSSGTEKEARYYQLEECELINIDIHQHVQGDVVLECIHLEHGREELIFRVMFHTSFVQSKVLILSCDDVDVMWDARDQMLKNFKAEVRFSDANALPSMFTIEGEFEDKNGTNCLTHEVEEIIGNVVHGQDGLLPKEFKVNAENGDIAPRPPPPPPIYVAPSPQITPPFQKEFEHLKIQLKEIKSATDNFGENKLIGRGGFGKVYMGEVSHSRGKSMSAFKRLDPRFGQGDPEFWKEILMLSDYKHTNLISLLGFCDEGGERILVYEYASNGSLDRHLSSTRLTWIQRIKICLDAARGLSFLHDDKGTMQRVLHRDIKSANILLDDKWNAKVSDMGLSKIGPANQPHTFIFTSKIVGTPGYCDPQYMYSFTLSKESDVYSFGVVLFEVLCGRLCFTQSNGKLDKILVPVWKKAYVEKKLHEIVFQDLTQPMNSTSLEIFSGIAYQCLHKYREDRPTIAHVVEKLETALEFQKPPNKYEDGLKVKANRVRPPPIRRAPPPQPPQSWIDDSPPSSPPLGIGEDASKRKELLLALQLKPHSAIWRLVHEMAVIYLVALTILLFQTRDKARQFMKYLHPDLGVELSERSYGVDCRLYVPENPTSRFINVYETLFDKSVPAQIFGWWGKAIIIRNQPLLWVLSLASELMELTFRHMLPCFNECWWDSIVIDILICNWFGIWVGMHTVRHFDGNTYKWVGISRQPYILGKVKRSLGQFTPAQWDKDERTPLLGPWRFIQVFILCIVFLTVELNTFFLKFCLWVPPRNPIIVCRLVLWWLIAIPTIQEYNSHLQDRNPVGAFCWLSLAICIIELFICIKFGRGLFPTPMPRWLVIMWTSAGVIFLMFLTLWTWQSHRTRRRKRK